MHLLGFSQDRALTCGFKKISWQSRAQQSYNMESKLEHFLRELDTLFLKYGAVPAPQTLDLQSRLQMSQHLLFTIPYYLQAGNTPTSTQPNTREVGTSTENEGLSSPNAMMHEQGTPYSLSTQEMDDWDEKLIQLQQELQFPSK